MIFLGILWAACLLDQLLGDPRWFPHPVRLIGWFADWSEKNTRKQSRLSERGQGRLTVLLVLLFCGGGCSALLILLACLPDLFFQAGAAFILYTCLAARDLVLHARRVHEALALDLETARQRVAMIVGRDTSKLDQPGVIRACVESVAESMSDGIVAPLFWVVVGAVIALPWGGNLPIICGVTAAMLYKGINTMDSMFGYKNKKYLDFGSCPARLDDLVNFLPARISGLAIVAVSGFWGGSRKNSSRILFRDHKKHTSPNAGWPEAAMAGALGIRLGGVSSYGGTIIHKPEIGDPLQEPKANHILQANALVLSGSLFCLLCFSVVLIISIFSHS